MILTFFPIIGHSFRRTSTKLLSNISADFVLKRHRAWKSASKTESCVENNLHSKDKTDVFPNVYKPEPSTDDTQSSALVSNDFYQVFMFFNLFAVLY